MQPLFRTEGSALVLAMPAEGVDLAWLAQPLQALGLPAAADVRALRIEHAADWRWRSVDATFLALVLDALRARSPQLALAGLPADLQKLLELARATEPAPAPESAPSMLARLGLRAERRARDAWGFIALLGEVVRLLPRFAMGRAKFRGSELLEIVADCSSRALPIVALVNLLMGAILAFVGALQLRRFGAGIYVADLIGIATVRELTPIMTGIVLAGRTGASIAAHIGAMKGNEEIDALTTLGVEPAEFLVLPRFFALTALTPLLYAYGCAFAILGGLLVSMPILDLSGAAWMVELRHAVGYANFAIGALKAAVFGALVALLGCHYGLVAERSAAGVGSATTRAVVASIVGIIVLDAVFALCANALHV